jgi:hypothetical protein
MNKKNNLGNIMKLVILLVINFSISGCSNKLLNPLKNGAFGNEQKNIIKNDIYLFVYPTKFYDVCAAEKCVVKIVKKIEDEFFILTKGKYEISYANLSDCFVKEGEIIQRGKIIGSIRKNSNQGADNLEPAYLRISVKDNKGNFIETDQVFK